MGKNQFYIPLVLAATLIIGIYMGGKLEFNQRPIPGFSSNPKQAQKINQLINYINRDYVEEVNADSLLDETINEFLHKLDPHSSYISTSEIKSVEESMQGNFEGIGVEFNILNDTLIVVSAIAGGPSELLGIQSGDRIIEVEGESIAGIGVTNDQVIKLLRGEKGSVVSVGILRPGNSELLNFEITRNEIPIHSLDVAYLIDTDIAYIKLNRFAETTYDEFHDALKDLKEQGAKKLILDLRGNPGGYLHVANAIADDLLSDGELIVFTEGRNREKNYTYATEKGIFEEGQVVVLIDEGSASASEIIAGAIQDNDRGWIAGRRSFGKGLVQEQWELSDGSAVRLTVARYYTPSGRCIQKSYENGYDEYMMESYHRFDNGELTSDTAIIADSLIYFTKNGREVYGGGGILPDFTIPIDTSLSGTGYYRIVNMGELTEFALREADRIRNKKPSEVEFVENFRLTEDAWKRFKNHILKNDVEWTKTLNPSAKEMLENRLIALIARQLYGDNAFYRIYNRRDEMLKKAIDALDWPLDSASI
jgi:carboxyl-terminal processing protease